MLYSGQQCLNQCERRGQSYSWCRTFSSNWDYCTIDPNYNIRNYANQGILTASGYPCGTECSRGEGTSYYWCRPNPAFRNANIKNWDYCSPKSGLTELGKQCDNTCDTYGFEYKWCKVGSSWGYCSY